MTGYLACVKRNHEETNFVRVTATEYYQDCIVVQLNHWLKNLIVNHKKQGFSFCYNIYFADGFLRLLDSQLYLVFFIFVTNPSHG